jgi:hypothetical protein
MLKIQYKEKTGALHIGGGLIFRANEPVELADKEANKLVKNFPKDLELVEDKKEEVNEDADDSVPQES